MTLIKAITMPERAKRESHESGNILIDLFTRGCIKRNKNAFLAAVSFFLSNRYMQRNLPRPARDCRMFLPHPERSGRKQCSPRGVYCLWVYRPCPAGVFNQNGKFRFFTLKAVPPPPPIASSKRRSKTAPRRQEPAGCRKRFAMFPETVSRKREWRFESGHSSGATRKTASLVARSCRSLMRSINCLSVAPVAMTRLGRLSIP